MMCADGSMMEILELRRYESQKQQVEGKFELAGPGMVLLLWDNSFSWVNPKQLSYTVELHQDTPPETPAEKVELALSARLERQRRIIRAETNVDAIDATIRTQELGIEELRRQIKELEEKLEKTEAAKLAAAMARDRLDEAVDTLAWELNGNLGVRVETRDDVSFLTAVSDCMCFVALNWRCLDEAVLDLIATNLDSRSLTAWYVTLRSARSAASASLLRRGLTLYSSLLDDWSPRRSLTNKRWYQRLNTHRPLQSADGSDNQRDDDRRSEEPALG